MDFDEAYNYLKSTCDETQMKAVDALLASRTEYRVCKAKYDDDRHRYYREYMRAYRKKNASKMREYQRKYHKEHKK